MKFLDGLADDIKRNLLEQLRVLWTHTSTALEGNMLTLGETAFVLSEGLTIQGKPLKDHRDVEGHARAVDLMYELVQKAELDAGDLLNLHKLVIDEQILDVYKPVGGWKKENNSVTVTTGGRQAFIEYSDYWEVPHLMERWLEMLNGETQALREPKELGRVYARLHVSFVAIHPFYDGNGRVARLAANVPCLKSGQPPIIIPSARRFDYLTTLADYTLTNGVPSRHTPLIHEDVCFEAFCSLCAQSWQETLALVEKAHAWQQDREQRLARHNLKTSDKNTS
jgi:Fic family protein